jgi:uncharacterized protein (TIGR02453 family)
MPPTVTKTRAPARATPPAAETFGGFADDAIQFLLELQAEQSRTWFKAHQDDYERLLRRPLELLVAELQTRLTDVYPQIGSVEPHIFRIQRDTRFAKDKSPYKTNIAANVPIRPPVDAGRDDHHTTPGIYLSFGLDGEYVALGRWHMEPDVVVRYRELLAKPRVGTALLAIVNGLADRGWQLGSMEALKRVPAPYPQDHVCAELLKRKGLAMSIQPGEGLSASHAFADWAVARLSDAAPMINWLDRHLA